MKNQTIYKFILILFTAFLLFCFQVLFAQTQVIKGSVKDNKADYPIIGASVVIEGTDPIIGSTTDIDGHFVLENVPYGRQTIIATFIGYKPVKIPNVLVNSGKQTILNITMEESVQQLEEIVIKDTQVDDLPVNNLAKVSARTFSTEQVNRFSGGRNDIARMVTSFAGVSAPNDQRNDIVVRGNSPTGLLWRIEGIPIGTTNHFATLGTTGGPVSALNTNLINTSDFFTGAFPAEYGNANAAIFDVKFRDGNKDKHEFTGQIAAFSGVEAMIEGPISKKNQSSYLVSGRYGIASVGAPGTAAKPFYQDVSYSINLGKSKLGKFKLFGFVASSHIDFKASETEEDDLFANPNEDAFPKNKLGMIGLSNVYHFNPKNYLKTTMGGSLNLSEYEQFNYIRNTGAEDTRYQSVDLRNNDIRYSFSTIWNSKINKQFSLRTGLIIEAYQMDFKTDSRDNQLGIPDTDGDGVPDFFVSVSEVNETLGLSQFYSQGEYKFTDKVSATFGLHTQYLGFSQKFALEPRAGLSWQFKPNQSFNLAYGDHSQLVPLPILFNQQQDLTTKIVTRTNEELDFMKSRHFVASYDRYFGEAWKLKVEAYFQSLYNIPVESTPSSYSTLNDGDTFTFEDKQNLVNEGTGSNQGVEISLERFFKNGFYSLVTTSVYDSKYKGSDGIERQTAFNNQYVLNVLGGKEWEIWDGNGAITFDTKFTTAGGKPFTPIDIEGSIANAQSEVRFEDRAYSERIDDYLRWDVKIGFRWNHAAKKMAHHWFLDFQNVTNRQNEFTRRFNEVTNNVNIVRQSGLFVDVLYRIQF